MAEKKEWQGAGCRVQGTRGRDVNVNVNMNMDMDIDTGIGVWGSGGEGEGTRESDTQKTEGRAQRRLSGPQGSGKRAELTGNAAPSS